MALSDRGGLAGRLAADAAALGLELDASSVDSLVGYLEQMARWNRTYNLTAVRDVEAMRVQHIVDSLAVVPALRERLGDGPARLLDVGSGGGLPGVVLAIAQPEWQVCCVDAVEKKTAFVRQVASVLRLSNLSAEHTRVEQMAPAECDMVISRAFASLRDFAALAGRHVRVGGTLAAMKGRQPDDEIAALHADGEWCLDALRTLQVPNLDAQRCLAFFVRVPGSATA